jgi:CRISPR/Cas system-associated endonuclease Cas1
MAAGSFALVDMDDKSYKNALALAKRAKLKPVSKKTSTGMELQVFGDNRDIMKFIKTLPEQNNEEMKMSDWKKIIENKIEQKVMARLSDETGDKEEYEKFFKAALKKFGVESPAELDDAKKKEFFDYVDANWKGDNEKAEDLDETEASDTLKVEPKKRKLAASHCAG